MDINIISPAHGIIIGATGSGKTTTFVNPVIQILGHASAGSSMICTDPKGELFQMHSKMLKERGYKCMVLDLRDPYSSFRWNPLGDIYDRYQAYVNAGEGLYENTYPISEAEGLELADPIETFTDVWYEYKGKAYSDRKKLIGIVRVEKQKIYDEMYEDLNDLISVICPIESKDDPVWEKGARSIIMATCLAMLEDSENPELEMTKEKFCFFNISKAIMNSENEFAALKDYFKGRDKLSKAVGLSRQVLSAADQTLSSYMSIAFDKLSMFNTPPVFAIFVMNETLKWIKSVGGVEAIYEINKRKAKALYDEIDRNSLFVGTAAKEDRSLMNVCFVMAPGKEELQDEFFAFAKERGMVGIKGHRSVGGFRASLYNACSEEDVAALIACMQEFESLKK
jgi:type IV secretory pathway TraG/TraD family ATPase VirD4